MSGTTDAYDAALEKPVVGSRLAALNGESCVGEPAPDAVMAAAQRERPLELEFAEPRVGEGGENLASD